MSSSFEQYFNTLKGKRITVIGMGISNRPLIRLLQERNIPFSVRDARTEDQLGDDAKKLRESGIRLISGPGYLEGLEEDVIYRTPGLLPTNPALKKASETGSHITSEMEAFFEVCPCKIVAVTGSDGKTTTTTIIAGLLQAEGYTVHLGGNIGRPLLSDVPKMKDSDIAVLELSSFQLMSMTTSPQVAVITNLAPNHLDKHSSMEEYVRAKKNIFLHQKKEDTVILNYDNDYTKSFAPDAKGRVLYFSRLHNVSHGTCIVDDVIRYVDADNPAGEEILPVQDIRIPGQHNVENYLAAIAAVHDMVSRETICDFAREFNGVEHRIEFVRELHGVRYYNDSIASSPTRTIAGLRSFNQKVILIAGGYDKHIPYDPLGPEVVEHVKLLVLTGATAPKIREAVEKAENARHEHLEIREAPDFRAAVLMAAGMAEPGDIVLMSPASASFDHFNNFMERGDLFKEIVNGLQ